MDAVHAEAASHGVNARLRRVARLTVAYSEPSELQALLRAHADVIARYDLLALEPSTERAFSSACANARADVVALPLGNRLPFRRDFARRISPPTPRVQSPTSTPFNSASDAYELHPDIALYGTTLRLRPATLAAAAANGIAIEVAYNAALLDVASRRNFFANATAVARAVGSGVGGGVSGGGAAGKAPGILLAGGRREDGARAFSPSHRSLARSIATARSSTSRRSSNSITS
eukprot:29130-Pelagococcus_subviridis.AAC.8